MVDRLTLGSRYVVEEGGAGAVAVKWTKEEPWPAQGMGDIRRTVWRQLSDSNAVGFAASERKMTNAGMATWNDRRIALAYASPCSHYKSCFRFTASVFSPHLLLSPPLPPTQSTPHSASPTTR
ncbi:hypothetical protein Hypma_011505 [Hypsizygus marmoreus]|uniref:Uncharacterized protein n=1 Tax=Hypsizygus marmoreus TaxID=39966 RepID=A0A369JFP6_HYPMA|nr:hypothetical protein Hypma_011505 [Hypsizygus marmoreus]